MKSNNIIWLMALVTILFTNCKAQEMTTSTAINARTINVTGTAEIEVVPDIIEFTVNIKEYWKEEFEPGKKYEDYKTKVPMTQIEPLILGQLKKAGVKDDQIKVSAAGNYYRPAGKELLVNKTLVLTLDDFETVDRIIKSVDPKGVGNMQISALKHSKMESFKKEVKIAALKAAKEKALYLLESVDEKLGKVLMISEGEYGYNPPVAYKMELKSAGNRSSQPSSATELRKITIKYEMNATFAIVE
jgi:uncharacterized protein